MLKEKFLFYAFSRKGLGHITRIARVVDSIRRTYPMHYAIASDQTIPSRFDFICDFYHIPNHDWSNADEYQDRVFFAQLIAKQFQPSVIIIDYYPFCEKNIDPEIDKLIKVSMNYNRDVLVFSIFRGFVSGTDNRKTAFDRSIKKQKLINHLFIALPESEKKTLIHSSPSLSKYMNKCTFIGFIKKSSIEDNDYKSLSSYKSHKWDIVIQMGGGGDDVEDRLVFLSKVIKYVLKKTNAKILISVGRNTPKTVFKKISLLFDTYSTVRVVSWVDKIFLHMKHSKIVISAAGYNTCCELLELSCHRIVLPRKTVTGKRSEQWQNAQLFKRHGAIDFIVDIEEMHYKKMAILVSGLYPYNNQKIYHDNPCSMTNRFSIGKVILSNIETIRKFENQNNSTPKRLILSENITDNREGCF